MKIIYPLQDGEFAIISPAEGVPPELAAQAVPEGLVYRVVEDDFLPADTSTRAGWRFDFEDFDAAITVVPLPVATPDLTPAQFWGVVMATGHEQQLWDHVASIEDPTTRAFVTARLKYSLSYQRNDPLVEDFRLALGMTSEELDALWLYAAQ